MTGKVGMVHVYIICLFFSSFLFEVMIIEIICARNIIWTVKILFERIIMLLNLLCFLKTKMPLNKQNINFIKTKHVQFMQERKRETILKGALLKKAIKWYCNKLYVERK